jgi:hypothetical protein
MFVEAKIFGWDVGTDFGRGFGGDFGWRSASALQLCDKDIPSGEGFSPRVRFDS